MKFNTVLISFKYLNFRFVQPEFKKMKTNGKLFVIIILFKIQLVFSQITPYILDSLNKNQLSGIKYKKEEKYLYISFFAGAGALPVYIKQNNFSYSNNYTFFDINSGTNQSSTFRSQSKIDFQSYKNYFYFGMELESLNGFYSNLTFGILKKYGSIFDLGLGYHIKNRQSQYIYSYWPINFVWKNRNKSNWFY